MDTHSDQNTVGAVIFFCYIIAALVLTGLILEDLRQAHLNKYYIQRRRPRDNNRPASRENGFKISIISSLAVLSFSVLSYNMLNFLVQSHQYWARRETAASMQRHSTTGTYLVYLKNILTADIWRWAVSSHLFQDFGEALCCEPGRSWWTQLVLLYSFGWNLYMSIQGTFHSPPVSVKSFYRLKDGCQVPGTRFPGSGCTLYWVRYCRHHLPRTSFCWVSCSVRSHSIWILI